MELGNFKLNVTRQNVFKFVDDVAVYKAYTKGEWRLAQTFSSPFREDSSPSFTIYEDGYWFDFGTGKSGDCVTLVMEVNRLDFRRALIHIIYTFSLEDRFNLGSDRIYEGISKTEIARRMREEAILKTERADIKIKVRPFEDMDYRYWEGFGITAEILKTAGIVCISHYFLNGVQYKASLYAYAFLEKKDGNLTIKIYQPHSKRMKWLSNNTRDVWELWTQLPEKGDELIICSSRKDALALKAALKEDYEDRDRIFGVVSLQSESVMPKKSVIDELKSRFNYIFVLLDFDRPGNDASIRLCEQFNLFNLTVDATTFINSRNTNFHPNGKDVADVYRDLREKGLSADQFNRFLFRKMSGYKR